MCPVNLTGISGLAQAIEEGQECRYEKQGTQGTGGQGCFVPWSGVCC